MCGAIFMMGKTRSGSEVALIREPSSTTALNLGVNGDNITSSSSLFDFDRLILRVPLLTKNANNKHNTTNTA